MIRQIVDTSLSVYHCLLVCYGLYVRKRFMYVNVCICYKEHTNVRSLEPEVLRQYKSVTDSRTDIVRRLVPRYAQRRAVKMISDFSNMR